MLHESAAMLTHHHAFDSLRAGPGGWERVLATETGYTPIEVECVLSSGEIVTARTLSYPDDARIEGALPSERYLGLLRAGARHHKLSEEWQTYLAALPTYEQCQRPQAVAGALVTAALALPVGVTAALSASAASAAAGADAGAQAAAASRAVGGAVWSVHDRILRPVFGDGGGARAA